MKITNKRFGFATNSSSTHSILFGIKGATDFDVADCEFGWSLWTAGSRCAKDNYIFTQLVEQFYKLFPSKRMAILGLSEKYGFDCADKYPWNDPDNWASVDHQSRIYFPVERGTKLPPVEFVKQVREYYQQDDLIIIGGNDNDDDVHPLENEAKSGVRAYSVPFNTGPTLIKQEGDFWVTFNPDTGERTTFSFDYYAVEERSTPDLVDIKVTDYCPFECHFCYQGSDRKGKHSPVSHYKMVSDLVKLNVFEAAIGGGEPTLWPDFWKLLKELKSADITPNFTTRNLQWVNDFNKLALAKECVGGIAYSCEELTNRVMKDLLTLKDAGLSQQISLQMIVGPSKIDLDLIFNKMEIFGITNLTLLKYKETHRGADKAYYAKRAEYTEKTLVESINAALKDRYGIRVGIDTPLAAALEANGTLQGVDSRLYQVKEGHNSLYIDYVEKRFAKSSYVPETEYMCLPGTDKILETFRSWNEK